MEIARIEGATRTLGAPPEWDNEKNGHCSALPIRDVRGPDESHWMISAWQPSIEELQMLARGESIKLWIQGTLHPVVAMSVGPVV